MDPALWELYESGSPEDEVSVILRLADAGTTPNNVRVVSSFGTIVTARVRRGDIHQVWESAEVVSVKAPRIISWPMPIDEPEDAEDGGDERALPAPAPAPGRPVPEDGTGVVVGMCDWGFDFTHANFRNADGTTRLVALWDQGARDGPAPPGFGYGRWVNRAEINAALQAPDPFTALGYHPASGDPTNTGSHGTHVADILAGNRREPGSEVGLASGADIVFVHVSEERSGGLANFGDSVRLLEGIDFIRRQAESRPCVIHLSAGKTGGAHRGETPFEQAVDAMLLGRTNLAFCQSAGNYASAAMHTHTRLGPDRMTILVWVIATGHGGENELEVWYSGRDVFDATLTAPNGAEFSVRLGERTRLRHGDVDWGAFHHRANEPNSGMNHIAIFVGRSAPSGRWRLALHGREVVDGRLHAWIERDARGRYQSRFLRSQATSLYTTNTICNSFRAIAVGAYDGTRPDRPSTPFSSRGPTADGRQKPEIVAPGFRIRAARSTPVAGWSGEPRLCVKSGTSMAAPSVSGTIALMLQAAGRPLTIDEIRSLLIGTADPTPKGQSSTRLGYGYLNTAAAVDAARRITADVPVTTGPQASTQGLQLATSPSPGAPAPGAAPPARPAASSSSRVREDVEAPQRGEDWGYARDDVDAQDDAASEGAMRAVISLEDVHEALMEIEEAEG